MPKKNADFEDPSLSRREREVMEVLFRKENATARDVWSALGESRTYSTVRKQLSILEEKGHVTHRVEGATFLYSPRVEREVAATSALSRLVDTFFQGSVAGAVSSLLGDTGEKISSEELERISRMIEDARRNREEEPS
ncbi:MAG: BlaI/MecI/CopY family transcriptional regulator [Verrucomicrobiales bacterium]|nr:BlaI/MecI/CopY family transcriptional regulator [Verrucomicrobiales bacterium]